MPFTLKQLEQALGVAAQPAGAAVESIAPIGRVVIDSRQVGPGDLFFALPGRRQDGADFASDAWSRGAVGVVTQRACPDIPPGCWQLVVPDALHALQRVAAWRRSEFQGPVVGVTGSHGKSTARAMIEAVLRTAGPTVATQQNWNNHIGLPLSMLPLGAEQQFAVLELGASAVGEIAALSAVCRPTCGVITAIGLAHLEGFGSSENLLRAKWELAEAVPEGGTLYLNGDDPQLRRWVAETSPSRRIVWFGRGVDCDVTASRVQSRDGEVSFDALGRRFRLPAWGRHHVYAALAAVAVGRDAGLDLQQIAAGLARFQPLPMRCQVERIGSLTLVNDAYNSSPATLQAALVTLREVACPGRRIVVCGDMRELGPTSARLHYAAGQQMVTLAAADRLIACGDQARNVAAGARAAGLPPEHIVCTSDAAEALNYLADELQPGDVVLLKGSRAVGLEAVAQGLHACFAPHPSPLRRVRRSLANTSHRKTSPAARLPLSAAGAMFPASMFPVPMSAVPATPGRDPAPPSWPRLQAG